MTRTMGCRLDTCWTRYLQCSMSVFVLLADVPLVVLDPGWMTLLVSSVCTSRPEVRALLPPSVSRHGLVVDSHKFFELLWGRFPSFRAMNHAAMFQLLTNMGVHVPIPGSTVSIVPNMFAHRGVYENNVDFWLGRALGTQTEVGNAVSVPVRWGRVSGQVRAVPGASAVQGGHDAAVLGGAARGGHARLGGNEGLVQGPGQSTPAAAVHPHAHVARNLAPARALLGHLQGRGGSIVSRVWRALFSVSGCCQEKGGSGQVVPVFHVRPGAGRAGLG